MITVIVIIVGVLKNCSGGMAIENTENYVATFTYYHHFKHTHMHSSFQNVAIYISIPHKNIICHSRSCFVHFAHY